MERLSTTAFGPRPIAVGQILERLAPERPAPDPVEDKWTLMQDLTAARAAFGVGDRDLLVLNALLSFRKGRALDPAEGLIVFPSNATLSDRVHGMAESTLRRRLAALVAAGLIRRHDSPNGKRYAVPDGEGGFSRAFGFDLTPLVELAAAIRAEAASARAEAERLRRLREAATLALRDLRKLTDWLLDREEAGAGDLAETAEAARRGLRRKLDALDLKALKRELDAALEAATRLAEATLAKEKPADAAHSGRHHLNSKPNIPESEPCLEKQEAAAEDVDPPEAAAEDVDPPEAPATPPLPLALVAKACPEIENYARHGLETWADLVEAADFVRGMMGVSPDAWLAARRTMGPAQAAITLAAILERIADIRSPGGYLRALTAKAAEDGFSPAPMVMALLSRREEKAA